MFEKCEMFRDGHGGDWFHEDAAANFAPPNARYHSPVRRAEIRSRKDRGVDIEFSFSAWKAEPYLTPLSWEELLRQKLGVTGPGIEEAERALDKHIGAHDETLRIEQKMHPLQQALNNPMKARVLGLDKTEINAQLGELELLRDKSLEVVSSTDAELAEFALDNVYFRKFYSTVEETSGLYHTFQERTVVDGGHPLTKQHHRVGNNRSLLDKLLGR